VLDHRPRATEPGQVAGLGEDGRGPDRGQPVDRGHQVGQLELVEHCDHAGLDLGEPAAGVPPVGQRKLGAFERARSLGGDPDRIGQSGEHRPHDAQARGGWRPSGAARPGPQR
jgi:hypothetical protein